MLVGAVIVLLGAGAWVFERRSRRCLGCTSEAIEKARNAETVLAKALREHKDEIGEWVVHRLVWSWYCLIVEPADARADTADAKDVSLIIERAQRPGLWLWIRRSNDVREAVKDLPDSGEVLPVILVGGK